MKRVTLIGVLGLCCLMMATTAWAQVENLGSAGCGLGSVIFKGADSKGKQILASITNGLYGNQSFGITSGTSNCTASGVIKESRAQQAFAEVNFDSLSQEMAKGQGEHLTAFAYLMGCSESSIGEFSRVVQQNYTQIFPSTTTTPQEMIGAVKQSILTDSALAHACQA